MIQVGSDIKEVEAVVRIRHDLISGVQAPDDRTCEGGCGVIGIIGTMPLEARYIIRPCAQMRNRGNGKGGGIAAVGIFPDLPDHYAIHVGFLNESVRSALEKKYLLPLFDIDHAEVQPSVDDHREVGLEIEPPKVYRYFVRVRQNILDAFMTEAGFRRPDYAEDEFVYRNSFNINLQYYANKDSPEAFVLSHGRNLLILKAVGYAEDIARYYQLEDTKANVWIGHQRYPTRGRVWHPGGAHPFIGLHEALVHNGDFANYHSVTEYLRQKGTVPLFVTDTEVSVLLFDYYVRVLGYPLEYVIEALAPTPEGDFERLPKRIQRIYRAIQTAHLHGSPDGPWFFIIARADPDTGNPQLIGITDVSMLRPQVFALQEGHESFGAIASEKQAIDAFFEELSAFRPDIPAVADMYWNARGGSCTDGGAFVYTVSSDDGQSILDIRDKFGNRVDGHRRPAVEEPAIVPRPPADRTHHVGGDGEVTRLVNQSLLDRLAGDNETCQTMMEALRHGATKAFFDSVKKHKLPVSGASWRETLGLLTLLRDQKWDYRPARPSFVLAHIQSAIDTLLDEVPLLPSPGGDIRLHWTQVRSNGIPAPSTRDATLVIDSIGFPPEGTSTVSRLVVDAYAAGWKKFIIYRTRGHRFIGCGLGPGSQAVRIDVYGSSGDYLGSGLDGASIYVHGNAQDQVGQILKSGRIVIFGDVGQTFLYGAKGGDAFVLGNAAGRPLINAVGKIRAVINGTCLDYCAESFMAGNQVGGGFVIINGLSFDRRGMAIGMELKYPGNNLFSLASGGACYLNDPYHTVDDSQLNGATFVRLTQADWATIHPYLKLNEELFGISIRFDLLVVDGVLKWPKEVFRKVVASTETRELDWSSLTAE